MQESDAAAPTDTWHYEHESERHGPHSLAEMLKLVQAGVIRRFTRVWPPTGEPAPASEFLALVPAPADRNAGMQYVIPVNRSGWAIAAGYLGLFSFFPVLNYIGLIVSLYAAYDLKKHPDKLGWGRVITGFVISIPMSVLYTWMFLSRS